MGKGAHSLAASHLGTRFDLKFSITSASGRGPIELGGDLERQLSNVSLATVKCRVCWDAERMWRLRQSHSLVLPFWRDESHQGKAKRDKENGPGL